MTTIATTSENIDRLNNLPIRGHRYVFSVGKVRKDGKVAVLVKAIVKVTNGNLSYFSFADRNKTFQLCNSIAEANQVVSECVYVIRRRAGLTHEQAVQS